MTAIVIAVLGAVLWRFVQWAFIDAVWVGQDAPGGRSSHPDPELDDFDAFYRSSHDWHLSV